MKNSESKITMNDGNGTIARSPECVCERMWREQEGGNGGVVFDKTSENGKFPSVLILFVSPRCVNVCMCVCVIVCILRENHKFAHILPEAIKTVAGN